MDLDTISKPAGSRQAGWPATMPYVSVVIPTYEREGLLCQTLGAIVEQTYPRFEVIVVDQTQNHLRSTETFIRHLIGSRGIHYFKLETPSLPAARNYGISQASGEVVLFIDDDVLPARDLVAAHASSYSGLDVGGVAGRRNYPPYAGVLEKPAPVGMLEANTDHVSNFSSKRDAGDVNWASGCNMSFRRAVLLKVGGFDPAFIGSAVYEDVDLSYRVRRAGYRIIFNPRAHLVHLAATDGGCGNRRRDRSYHVAFWHNSLLFALKNLPVTRWPVVFASRFARSLALARRTGDLRVPLLFFWAALQAHVSWSRRRHQRRRERW